MRSTVGGGVWGSVATRLLPFHGRAHAHVVLVGVLLRPELGLSEILDQPDGELELSPASP